VRIGIPKEIKNHEYRVGMIPAGVHALVSSGHEVVVQEGAGLGSGIPNEDYIEAGARLVPDAEGVWSWAEMVVKVKEPVAPEYGLMRPGQILFTYLHLAPLPELTDVLLERHVSRCSPRCRRWPAAWRSWSAPASSRGFTADAAPSSRACRVCRRATW
jgi:alanine dehydrogenase